MIVNRLMSVFEERDFLFDGGEVEKEMEDDLCKGLYANLTDKLKHHRN